MKNLLTVFTLLFLFACQTNTTSTTESEQISLRLDNAAFAEKLKAMPTAKLIDIRTPEEFQAGAIEGFVNMDFYADDFEAQLQNLNKEQATFIYCRSGGRSGKTLKKMRGMGFQEVYELQSGYSGWK